MACLPSNCQSDSGKVMEYAGSGPHLIKSGDQVSLPMLWKGNTPQAPGWGIQLPFATKTEPEKRGEPRFLDVNIGTEEFLVI